MNKFLKAMGCVLIGGSLLFATACGKKGSGTETRPLNLAIGALDGNFNPFFYTSANDGEVISMTQVSLLGVDPSGQPAVGDNYPVVAKDYAITYYDAITGGTASASSSNATKRTEYEFLIKNGMKFSDGSDLTIKDVLFNFYVYLDPAYTGSNTMYSVDIQGLAAYQQNDSTLAVDAEADNSAYAAKAQSRIQALVDWSNNKGPAPAESDIKLVATLFEEELNGDWTAIETTWQETYGNNYNFQYAWQAYLFQEQIVDVQMRRKDDGTYYQIRVDENNNEVDPSNKAAYDKAKNVTTLDPWRAGADGAATTGSVQLQHIIDEIAAATTDAKINEYISQNSLSGDEAKDYAYLQLTKKYCVDYVYASNLDSNPDSSGYGRGYAKVLTWWATGANAYSSFLADERGKALENSANDMFYISGIQTKKVTDFNGKNLGESHDVLKIVINGVDPAAIWNFGVTIAPMYYYSGTYKNVNYIEKATAWEHGGVASGEGEFGVKRGDFYFFEDVVKGTGSGKSTLPVGAGVYKASTQSGKEATNGNDFNKNNIVYYQRNDYFNTMGSKIGNAKIKYLQYKVLEDDRIIAALNSGAIDYGQPSATTTNLGKVEGNKSYRTVKYDTNGYGYVGINPTYVPDENIRRVIMRAMDIGESISYYGDLASPIYRPMSSTSWAYPENPKTPANLKPFADPQEIKTFLSGLGYTQSGGLWKDKYGNAAKYTFTIAGATSDHPAYGMFMSAKEMLNKAGFNITVSTSANALRDLTQGKLAIWAAAYSTGIDPDLYQVYHKDSQATSVLNWGYKTILNDTTGKYSFERGKIETLSEKIEAARKTLNQKTRADYYKDCLDIIMDLAIQLPIYQRQDLCVFNKKVINEKSVNLNADHINGVLYRIWEVNYA